MLERRLYSLIDWWLLAAIVAVSAIGMMMIYSTTYDETSQLVSNKLITQGYALVAGLIAFSFFMFLDYRVIANNSWAFYLAVIVALALVLMFGDVVGGSRRWLWFGPVNVQPSEFAKIALTILLAGYFAERSLRGVTFINLAFVGLVTVIPFMLIVREPDLGSAAGLLPVAFAITYIAGLRFRVLALLVMLALLTTPVAWTYALEDYQRSRLLTFLDPAQDAQGAGYQQIQAKITVGSGGLTGKGFLQGTQGQYKFLPVAHNDFIFSILAEEHGFLGVIVVLGLYLFVILRGLGAARSTKDRLGAYLVVGVISSFTFQVVYNITMSAGLLPVKGLTLPLMSYGGSSLVATLAGFGLIANVRMRRFTN